MATEREIIEALAEIFRSENPELRIGIGDDGAVVSNLDSDLVLGADMAIEGVHFNRKWSSLFEIGAKITAANLADISAMGGVAKFLLISVGLTPDLNLDQVKELANGIKSEASLVNCQVIGGDISRSPSLIISISAIGKVSHPLTRSGAKIGDKVFISGLTGESAAGLAQLERGVIESKYISQHKKPKLDYEVINYYKNVNSLIDVSDGLLSECQHLAESSSVAIELDGELLRKITGFSDLESLANGYGIDPWIWVLTGGEDHKFLGSATTLPSHSFEIGEVLAGQGVKIKNASQIKEPGWRHF